MIPIRRPGASICFELVVSLGGRSTAAAVVGVVISSRDAPPPEQVGAVVVRDLLDEELQALHARVRRALPDALPDDLVELRR